MERTPLWQDIRSGNTTIAFLLILVAVGLAGNYFKFTLFLNIDFLFGSIFALLALQFFGLGRGIVAAALIASYTYVLWNHPYAIIIMTAEVAVVGWLMARRNMGLVLADTLYWLFIGMPLVFLFYRLVMHVPLSSTFIIMTKQAVNGIANALIARLIFTSFLLRSRSAFTSYKEIIYNLLALFVLWPALILMALSARTDFKTTDQQIQATLSQDSERLSLWVESWVHNRKTAISNLAEMAAKETPLQTQEHLEQTKKSDGNFLRVALINKEGISAAISPLIDEQGKSSLGIDVSDRSHFSILKQTLRPMLSDVFLARIGKPTPVVLVLAPLVINGQYNGHVAGSLKLDQIQQALEKYVINNGTKYTLLDKSGYIIMSNRTDHEVMKPLVVGKGALTALDQSISQWVPTLPPNTPVIERWRKSFYVAESSIGDRAEWTLVLEQPVAPFQAVLYDDYTRKLFLLFLLFLISLALAELLSRKVVITLERLNKLTHELPARLATDGNEIDWPVSRIDEANQLIRNFQNMGHSLIEQFRNVQQINESLEQRVEERTVALQESEDKLTTIFDHTKIHLWAFDGTIYTYTNKQWFDYTGQDPDSTLTIERWTSAIHPDDFAEAHGIWSANFATKTEHDNYFRLKRHDGVYRDFICHAVPIFDDNGVFRYFQGFNLDITERKQAEEALAESEERFRSLMENIPGVAVQGYAFDGAVLFWNRASEQLYGYSAEEALGGNLLELIIPEEMRADVISGIQQMKESGEPTPAGELLLQRKDGSQVAVFSSHAMVLPATRQPELFCLDIDLTERKQAEAELLQAKVAAESANTAKSQFLANMSHEIRTPMNGVIGMTQLLEFSGLTDEQREYVAALKLSSNNLLQLINDILDLSKIEAEMFTIECADFSLEHCINDIVLAQTPAIYGKDLTLEVELADNIPVLLIGDQLRVKQVLINLLANALKFTAHGTIRIATTLLEQQESSAVIQISVSDTGIGIAPEALDMIFHPFVQEDGSTTRKFGGTGLGLTICRRLAELMGGTVRVESTLGVGSCFCLCLPFSISLKMSIEPEVQLSDPFVWDSPSLQILIAEDDAISMKIVSTILEKLGHKTIQTTNGAECLTAFEQYDLDLVLIDLQMPVMSGEEAMKALRKRKQGADIPIIAVTAHALRGEREQFLKAGFDGYISKPLDYKELIIVMKEVLDID